jgi:hypothetical protein
MLWWKWVMRTVEGCALMYGISLAILWSMDASHNDLHLGWWFGWQLLYLMMLVPPCLTEAPHWVKIRTIVLFVLTLCVLGCNISFFVVRVVDFVRNCDTGSSCDVLQTMYAIAIVLALFQTLIASILLWLLCKCPALYNWHDISQLELPPLAM